MSFDPSPKAQELQCRLTAFMDQYIYPNEQRHVAEAEERDGPANSDSFSFLDK